MSNARLIVICGVLFDEWLQLFRQFFDDEDRGGWANWHASAAIDALSRIHIELRSRRKIWLIFGRMNAVDRACLNTMFVLGASVCNDVSHVEVLPKCKWQLMGQMDYG